jgi:hypothetical protein
LYAYVKPNAGPFSLVQHSVPELSITILINHDQLDAYLVEDPVAKFSRIQGNTQPRQVSHSSSSSSKKKKNTPPICTVAAYLRLPWPDNLSKPLIDEALYEFPSHFKLDKVALPQTLPRRPRTSYDTFGYTVVRPQDQPS